MCATIKFTSKCHTALVRPLAAVVTLLIQDCACQQPTTPCDDKPAGIVNDLHKLPATDLDRPQLGSIVYILGENIHFGCIRIGLERLENWPWNKQSLIFFPPVPVQLCGSDQNNLRRSYPYYTHIHTHRSSDPIRRLLLGIYHPILALHPGLRAHCLGKGDRSIFVCKIPRSKKKKKKKKKPDQHSLTFLFYSGLDLLTSPCSHSHRLDLSNFLLGTHQPLPTSTVFSEGEYPN